MEKWKELVLLKEIKNRLDIANEYILGCNRLLNDASLIPELDKSEDMRGADVTRGNCPHCGMDAFFSGTTDWLHRCAGCKKEYFVKVAPDAE